jgi:hypothetical protein
MLRIERLSRHPALILGLATLALHAWANGGYDYFRDELYFIVAGERLDWGYVDLPPLVPLIARLSRALFGDSLLGLRAVPALAAAATVALTVETARLLGGARYAGWLAGLAVMAAPQFQANGVVLSTEAVLPLTWLGVAYAVIRAERTATPRWWWAAGAIAGVACLDKYMVVFYLAALAAGLLATPQRRWLGRKAPWLALAIMLAIAAPNLLWQARHGWPFVEFSANVGAHKNAALTPVEFLVSQVKMLNPATLPLWLAGLIAFGVWRRFADLRWIAISWVLLIAAMIALHAKPYYPAGIYPLLFAGSAVALEAGLARRRGSALARGALAGLVIAGGVVLAPFTLPVLPVERFIAYLGWLGITPRSAENSTVGVLPHYYADMFGWRGMADVVGRAYAALPDADRARAVFFGRNYGEAAAIDLFGRAWRLPPAISTHNSYFLWGPRDSDGSVVLTFGRERAALLGYFEQVDAVGAFDDPYATPDERRLTLFLCRTTKRPMREIWPSLKNFS